jgi:hypothetical protein
MFVHASYELLLGIITTIFPLQAAAAVSIVVP